MCLSNQKKHLDNVNVHCVEPVISNYIFHCNTRLPDYQTSDLVPPAGTVI